MIAGDCKSKLSIIGANCMLSVPTVITGTDYELRSLANMEALQVSFLFEDLPFLISLQINKD
jgi:chemotaxis protein CheX